MSLGQGSVIGGYRIVRLIGRGGMGAVYLADDVRLGRKVALKVLTPDTADVPAVRERFIRESQIAASLDHPHILPIYEAGEADGQLFIAMRYVPGPDLDGVIARDGPLSVGRTVALIDQVGSALDAAHAAGLIHRDVKPGNVLVAAGPSRGTDHAYLTDFGLTKQAEYSAALTASGQLLGSVGYVAPEVIENRPIDGRVDIYSLGCVLYECLAGTQPYPRDTEIATLYAHVQAPPPSLAESRPELPAAIDAVIATAMAKTPDARYQSGAELARALTEATTMDSAGRHLTRGFLFADLRGYTAYVEAHGDQAGANLLETYRRLVRDVVRRSGGAEIKTEGDSFYVVFPSASEAVRCGLAITAAAAAGSAQDPARPIAAGVGIHAGETAETAEGYVGSAVNLAARICALAAAGEVLVSDTVRGLNRTSSDVAFTARGRKHLKGIAEPIAVYAASLALGDQGVTPRRMGPQRDGQRWIVLAVAAVVAAAVFGVVFAASQLVERRPPLPSDAGLAAVSIAPSSGTHVLGSPVSYDGSPGATAGSPGIQNSPGPSDSGIPITDLPAKSVALEPGDYQAVLLPGTPTMTIAETGWSALDSSDGDLVIGQSSTPHDRFEIRWVRQLAVDPCGLQPAEDVEHDPEQQFTAWAKANPALKLATGTLREFGSQAATEYDISIVAKNACQTTSPTSVDITPYEVGTGLFSHGKSFGTTNLVFSVGRVIRLAVTSFDGDLILIILQAPTSPELAVLQTGAEKILNTLQFEP